MATRPDPQPVIVRTDATREAGPLGAPIGLQTLS